MSTTEALGFRLRPPNPVQQITQKIAASRPGAWLFQRTLYPIEDDIPILLEDQAIAANQIPGW